MLQAIMNKPGDISFIQVDNPKANRNQVVIKIHCIGVCGSDIHVFHGKHPYTSYPCVQGHEVAGEIVSVGEDVLDFSIGDKVTVMPQVTCKECYPCTHNQYHICDNLKVMGFQVLGMASEYFAVDQECVIKVLDSMAYENIAMVEPLAVAVHALNRGRINQNDSVLVLGAGPIGNLVAQAAKGCAGSKVMITDISDFRLGIAKDCGIDFCINVKENSLGKVLKTTFGEDGPDIIFDCAGTNDTIKEAMKYARKGSSIVMVAVFDELPKVDLALLQNNELKIIGTMMYQKNDYLDAIGLIENNSVFLDKLVTDRFEFLDYKKAYLHIEKNKEKSMKVMIILNKEGVK